MKIAKPMLLITTPIGVFGSIYWAYQLAGGLVILLIALFLLIAAAFSQLIATARRKAREQQRFEHINPPDQLDTSVTKPQQQ